MAKRFVMMKFARQKVFYYLSPLLLSLFQSKTRHKQILMYLILKIKLELNALHCRAY